MRNLVFLLLLYSVQFINAQPLAQHNLYPFNPNFANPAATGLTACLELNVTDMHQWVGIDNAPNVQSFSVQKGMPFSNNKKNGLGVNLIRDSNGPSKSLGGELLYSFHVLIGRNQTTWLSLGLSGNIEQRRLDESGFTPVFDPAITGGMIEELAYNASGGIYLYNNRYFAGFALYNLLPVNHTMEPGYGGDRYYVSFQGGYAFDFGNSPLTLNTSIQGGAGTDVYQFDLNNRLRFENNLWLGLTLRKYLGEFETAGQNALVFIGYDWKNWNFCYNYNFDINGTQFHHYGTHQFSLGYRICPDKFDCPAYR